MANCVSVMIKMHDIVSLFDMYVCMYVYMYVCMYVCMYNLYFRLRNTEQHNNNIIIIMAGMAVFNVAGYLIEERRRWPVITASPRGQYSK